MIRPIRVLLAILAIVMILALCGCSALAQSEHRTTTLANEPKPLPGSLNQQYPFDPIEMTPDEFVEVLLGQTPSPALSLLFELSHFALEDGAITIGQPGGYITFYRAAEETERQRFENISIAGSPSDIEIVYYGTPYYHNYAFFFIRSGEQSWRLIDCIYNYADAEVQHNSRMSWLVGHGDQSATQEGIRFDTWYNPYVRRVEVSVITSGNQIASMDIDKTDVVVMSRPSFYNYTYTDEAGQVVDDTAVSVAKYVVLENMKDMYSSTGDSLQLIQLDAYQQLDVYTFDADAYSLTLAGSWQFDNASPVLLEGYTHGLFLEGNVVIPER